MHSSCVCRSFLKAYACGPLLQTDLRLLKEKVKRKQAILVRQEEEVAAKEAALAAAQRDIAAAQAGAETLSQQIRHLGAENDELRDKLEESKQQLQSNEQMIRWLNQQVGRRGCAAVCVGRLGA